MLRVLLLTLHHLLGLKGIAIISPSSRLHTTRRRIGRVIIILPAASLLYDLPPSTELTTIKRIISLGILNRIYAASSSPYEFRHPSLFQIDTASQEWNASFTTSTGIVMVGQRFNLPENLAVTHGDLLTPSAASPIIYTLHSTTRLAETVYVSVCLISPHFDNQFGIG